MFARIDAAELGAYLILRSSMLRRTAGQRRDTFFPCSYYVDGRADWRRASEERHRLTGPCVGT